MKLSKLVLSLVVMLLCEATHAENVIATSNYWGQSVGLHKGKVFEAFAAQSEQDRGESVRVWYSNLSQYPNLDDGVGRPEWIESKAFLLYYFSSTPPIRVSTNCWCCAAEFLSECRGLVSACESQRQLAFSNASTNITADVVNDLSERLRRLSSRKASLQRAEALLYHSVTNVFPRELSKVLSEDDYTIAESNAYNQAGINTNP